MVEPNDKYTEAVVVVSEFQEKLKAIGLNYNSEVSVWEGEGDQKIFTMHASSDPIAKQRTLQAAILADGTARLMETKEETYPPNADLHPENARIIKRSGFVHYNTEAPFSADIFNQFEDIFKVGNK